MKGQTGETDTNSSKHAPIMLPPENSAKRLDTPPMMKRQLAYVALLLASLGTIGVALYALIAAFRFFDVNTVFWYYFGGSVVLMMLGLAGLEVSTARIKTV